MLIYLIDFGLISLISIRLFSTTMLLPLIANYNHIHLFHNYLAIFESFLFSMVIATVMQFVLNSMNFNHSFVVMLILILSSN